jgi:hypothetical protein
MQESQEKHSSLQTQLQKTQQTCLDQQQTICSLREELLQQEYSVGMKANKEAELYKQKYQELLEKSQKELLIQRQ